MSGGLQYLEIGLGIALGVWMLWRVYTLTSRRHANRRLRREAKKFARQPWDDDKAGGRGNR